MSTKSRPTSVADELEKLTELCSAGAISRAEFEEAKRQVLGRSKSSGPDEPPPIPTQGPESSSDIELSSLEDVELVSLEELEANSESVADTNAADDAVEVPRLALEPPEPLIAYVPPPDEAARPSTPAAVVGYRTLSHSPTRRWGRVRKIGPWVLAVVVVAALAPFLVDLATHKVLLSDALPGHGSLRVSRFSAGAPSPGDGRKRRVWRAGDPFSCQAFQDRLDHCERTWTSRLAQDLRSKGITLGGQRISVDRPEVALSQAQALVFDSGGLHRCQVAEQRQAPAEQTWLKLTKACMKQSGCEGFAACHVSVFLRYVGQIPFHCRAYCNRRVYQCGVFFARKTLARNNDLDLEPVTEDVYEAMQPKFFGICLKQCATRSRVAPVRQRLYECIFQPDCELFSKCIDPAAQNKGGPARK